MNPIQSISVFGLGKLGACIAATFAARGFRVVGVDIDRDKVERVNAGLPPVEEPRLAETMAASCTRLRATLRVDDALETDASFFIPPSPSNPDGSFSNEYLLKAMQPLATALRNGGKKGHLFVCSSTTTPNACDTVLIPMLEKETGWRCGPDFGFCYNPEFIALGNVISGLLEPDLVLIGESRREYGDALEDAYRRYNHNQPPVARMSIISAELTKIALNSYITMKISFTNQLRLIAEQFPKADIHAILDALGSDTRIGKKYLRAGVSYGGPCFPRDNRLLAHTARGVGLRAPLAEASDAVNEMTKQKLLERVQALATKQDTIAILGLSYKPDTYIVEESAGLYLAQHLQRSGYKVLVHDWGATPANSPALHEFEILRDVGTLTSRPDVKVAVLCCPWPQYRELKVAPETTVVAPWKI